MRWRGSRPRATHSRASERDVDVPVLDHDRHGRERVALTWSGEAVTVFHAEARAMCRTDEMLACPVEEVVGAQVERCAAVGAAVAVGEEGIASTDEDEGEATRTAGPRPGDLEATRIAVANVLRATDRLGGRCKGGGPQTGKSAAIASRTCGYRSRLSRPSIGSALATSPEAISTARGTTSDSPTAWSAMCRSTASAPP